MSHGLDYLAKLYLGYQPISITELIGPKDSEQKSMRDVPLEKVVPYACEDADVTLQVAQRSCQISRHVALAKSVMRSNAR